MDEKRVDRENKLGVSDLGGVLRAPAPVVELDGHEYWIGLLDRVTRPLTEQESKLMINLVFLELNGKDLPEEQEPRDFLYQVIKRRCEVANIKMTQALMILLAGISESPGTAVMYTYSLAVEAAKRNQQVINLDTFCQHAFPMGVPTKEVLDSVWDEQKVRSVAGEGAARSDNMVDDFDHWPLARIGAGVNNPQPQNNEESQNAE